MHTCCQGSSQLLSFNSGWMLMIFSKLGKSAVETILRVILHVDSLALWKIINDEDAVLIPKNWERRELFQRIFALGIFWGGVSCYAATLLIVALSPGHSDITRFHPWSPIATGNHLDRTKKILKAAQTTGTVDVFDPCSGISGPTSRRASACPYLHEWWSQPTHVRCPVAQLLI